MVMNSIRSISCTFVIITCITTVTSDDQCKIMNCNERNTFCKYPTNTKSINCQDDFSDARPSNFINLILDEHNKHRSEVALGTIKDRHGKAFPTASNMMELEWDERLAELARRWLLQCNYDHDECRSTEKFESVGQNLAMAGSTNKPRSIEERLRQMVKDWHDEYIYFDLSRGLVVQSALNDKEITGHFTQSSWADTTHVGCAVSTFKEGNFYKNHLYCNYGPAGNIISMNVYEKGKPCELCPKETTCSDKYKGLCARPSSSASPFKAHWHNMFTYLMFSLPLFMK